LYDGVYPANTVGNKTLIYGKTIETDKLRAILDEFLVQTDALTLIRNDPVEIVQAYDDVHDQEVVGLVVALLAYGRVRSIKDKARSLIASWDASPAKAVDSGLASEMSHGFVYRFQKGNDLPNLLDAMARVRGQFGSLGAAFAAGIKAEEEDYAFAMDRFVERLRSYMGPDLSYGLRFLLPRSGETRGAAKRVCLYLRWMIRDQGLANIEFASSSMGTPKLGHGRDLGTWQALVPGRLDASKLIIPLDTHIARISRYIGLTNRKTMDLGTAQQITQALRHLCPTDPLVYDMALCHLGISGSCPERRDLQKCVGCPIRSACRLGRPPKGWTASRKAKAGNRTHL
jgi:uncharacterized protein (TIGR02757 family)